MQPDLDLIALFGHACRVGSKLLTRCSLKFRGIFYNFPPFPPSEADFRRLVLLTTN